MNNEPIAELVLEHMAVGDASSLRVKWLTDSYPPVGTQLYTHPVKEQDESFDRTASHMTGEYVSYKKELRDEEKLQFGMLFMNWNRSLKEPLVKPAYEQYVFEQAIAILRKAKDERK